MNKKLLKHLILTGLFSNSTLYIIEKLYLEKKDDNEITNTKLINSIYDEVSKYGLIQKVMNKYYLNLLIFC
jgi:hypothetical protein